LSRTGTVLIKRHLATLVGSRPVVPPPCGELLVPPGEAAGAFAEDAEATTDSGVGCATLPAAPDAGEYPAGADSGGVTGPTVDERELPAEVVALMEAARAEAERLEREARQRGEREGWEAGFAAGREAGRAQARQEMEEAVHAALALLEDARRERLVILRQAHQDAVRMALELAARILEREVSLSPEVVREQAAALLNRLEQGEKATLHVHPDDVPVIRPWLPELARACGAVLDVVADPAVGRGGVMVETQHGFLDGRLDRQLRRLGEALLAWADGAASPVALGADGDRGREGPDGTPGGDGGGRDGR
jgi:flagellar assembly protein FliH